MPPPPSLLTHDDLFLFNEGTHSRLYEKLGAHVRVVDGLSGVNFAVWAPAAEAASVVGDFNGWTQGATPLAANGSSGIWEGWVAGLSSGAVYKYEIRSRHDGYTALKADPFAFAAELAPRTASVVTDLGYEWSDAHWMANRRHHAALDRPVSIYEVHLGSWMRAPDAPEAVLGYRDLAPRLRDHLLAMGFTHVELMPVMEHPFYGSWGYQVTGYFAAASRYGSPQDLMYLIDVLHRAGIGVILDWVPSHFPRDEHSLAFFDGTHLYEHADPRRGLHADWDTLIFNYGRNEVRSFLLSSAIFWLDRYHADALRFDAVASMLYRDYSRKPGEWLPNRLGGREDLEAVSFLRQVNEAVYAFDEGCHTFAEESTAWPMVSRPTYLGGLGFGYKWDLGWMHDTLAYLAQDPVHRKYDHGKLTFRGLYVWTENYTLPLSHDEVVHEKGSLLAKMPGDDWQKFASLRLLLAYQLGAPGKKLLFMGAEIAQWREWDHDRSLDWRLLEQPAHAGVRDFVADCQRLYRDSPSLYQLDTEPAGFEWIDVHDTAQSTLSFLRNDRDGDEVTVVALNFTPVPRHGFRIGVPLAGRWEEVLNSDAECYGGSGQGNCGGLTAEAIEAHGRPYSLCATLPPLGAVFFRQRRDQQSRER